MSRDSSPLKLPGDAIRRAGITIVVYPVVAWVVFQIAKWFRRVLALPSLFESLLLYGLLGGFLLALALAWHYPKLGHGGEQGSVEP